MICGVCRQAEPRAGTTTVTLERGSATVVMKGVPALVCPNCGEDYLAEAVSARVLELAEQAFQSGVTLDVRQYAGAA